MFQHGKRDRKTIKRDFKAQYHWELLDKGALFIAKKNQNLNKAKKLDFKLWIQVLIDYV